MKCHKCGFVSFDYLSECKKCGINLEGSRSLLGMMDFKPSMPFFLGAMINAKPEGANGGSTGVAAQKPDAMGLGEIDFGGDLEFEIEEDVPALSTQPAKFSDSEILPQIELPEGFTLSLGEEEKNDDFELVIGPDFEQALSLELDAKDFDDLAQTAPVKDDLAGFQFDEPILDFSAAAPATESAVAEADSLIPEFSLNISLELEPNKGISAGDFNQPIPMQDQAEDNLVIDFSQNDLENLLVELDDSPVETKMGQMGSEQSDTHA